MTKARLTPALRQFMEAKEQYPDHILFFRMGDFYEMFFDDAVTAAGVLNIALTSRGKGTMGEAPMCGVPYHAYESYAAKLLKAGYRVAICEQVEDPKQAKGVVKRAVTTVLTPATAHLAGDGESASRVLMAVAVDGRRIGLASGDPTTGEVDVTEWSGKHAFDKLVERILMEEPREIVAPFGLLDSSTIQTFRAFQPMVHEMEERYFHAGAAEETIREQFQVASVAGFGLKGKTSALAALGGWFAYLADNYKTAGFALKRVRYREPDDHVVIDPVTRRNLELFHSQATGSKRGSFLWAIDRTRTPMGTRKLQHWIQFPPRHPDEIRSRQDVVEWFTDRSDRLETVREFLGRVPDVERILTRVALGTVSPPELVALKEGLAVVTPVRTILSESPFDDLVTGLPDVSAVFALLDSRLEAEPPRIKGPGCIRPGVDAELDELRAIVTDVKSALKQLEQREREKTGIPNLKIKFNKVFGYYIEISNVHLRNGAPPGYDRKQTLVNAERFITPELKAFEERVLSAEDRIGTIERERFDELIRFVHEHRRPLFMVAETLSRIDVLAGFAALALERDYRRPEIVEANVLRIEQGRHPVVAVFEGDDYVPNDTQLDETRRLAIITGPNMGGKSTYLRQNALMVLLAHMGSFVPARQAEIGLTDRIFTRVGTSDNLIGGESTFMVEMIETANILHNATARSLVVLDEVGRGTATFDGLSLAWAITEHLAGRGPDCPRTFFATHYHELTDIDQLFDNIVNLNVVVKEWNNELLFLRKIVPGAADRSYGIQVARLAGIPKDVIRRAFEVLENIRKNEFTLNGKPKLAVHDAGSTPDRPLFNWDDHPVLVELKHTDINALTPLEALNLLARLKEHL